MVSFSSSASAVLRLDEYCEHNMWNPLLELLFLEQVSGIFESFVVEIIWPRPHFLVILFLIYSVTRKGAYDSA